MEYENVTDKFRIVNLQTSLAANTLSGNIDELRNNLSHMETPEMKSALERNGVDILNTPVTVSFSYGDENKDTLLSTAVINRDLNAVNAILDAGADDNAKGGPLTISPIVRAVDNGDVDIIERLLQEDGINVNEALLLVITSPDKLDIFERLLKVDGIDVNEKINGTTFLTHAALHRNNEAMKRLLDIEGIDINLPNDANDTALSLCRGNGNDEGVKMLLGHNGIITDRPKTDSPIMSHSEAELS